MESAVKKSIKRKIDKLDKIIGAVEIGKDGRLMQLYKQREELENRFQECER
jgi:hypothetical protein